MVPKIALALLVAIVAVIAISQAWSNHQDKDEFWNIRKMAESAKIARKKEVRLPAPIPYYATVTDLDDALGSYSTVIAQLIFKHTRLSSDSSRVEAWYKFKVDEFLSQPENPQICSFCNRIQSIPPELLPIDQDEVLLVGNTGDLEIDGVRVYMDSSSFPSYELNEKYLLFLNIDMNSRIASTDIGSEGVSLISSEGDLHPVNANSQKLNAELKKRYGNIEVVKENLKLRKFARQQ